MACVRGPTKVQTRPHIEAKQLENPDHPQGHSPLASYSKNEREGLDQHEHCDCFQEEGNTIRLFEHLPGDSSEHLLAFKEEFDFLMIELPNTRLRIEVE